MPFYFPPFLGTSKFSDAVIHALLEIEIDTQQIAVTPRVFIAEVRKHLFPLLPDGHEDILQPLSNPTWDDAYLVFVELAARSKGIHRNIEEIALAVQLLYSCSTSPQREFKFPDFLEVTHFLQMHDHARNSVRHLCREDKQGNFDIFRFCSYCWRQAIPNKRLCVGHQSGGDSSQAYKEAYRQKPEFDETIKMLLSREVLEFHKSNFQSDVLIPTSGLAEWIKKRRPYVQANIGQCADLSDEHTVQHVLTAIHSEMGVPSTVAHHYSLHNKLMANYPSLMWPMLLRAEAWFQVREEMHKGWGGARVKTDHRAQKNK